MLQDVSTSNNGDDAAPSVRKHIRLYKYTCMSCVVLVVVILVAVVVLVVILVVDVVVLCLFNVWRCNSGHLRQCYPNVCSFGS
jgi:Flp pilus assembly protein TadB